MVCELVQVCQVLLTYSEVSTEIENKYLENVIGTQLCCDIQLCDNFAGPFNFLKLDFTERINL